MQVRIGYPVAITGRVDEVYSPRCTTAVGLVMYGRNKCREGRHHDASMVGRVKGWIKKIM